MINPEKFQLLREQLTLSPDQLASLLELDDKSLIDQWERGLKPIPESAFSWLLETKTLFVTEAQVLMDTVAKDGEKVSLYYDKSPEELKVSDPETYKIFNGLYDLYSAFLTFAKRQLRQQGYTVMMEQRMNTDEPSLFDIYQNHHRRRRRQLNTSMAEYRPANSNPYLGNREAGNSCLAENCSDTLHTEIDEDSPASRIEKLIKEYSTNPPPPPEPVAPKLSQKAQLESLKHKLEKLKRQENS